MPPVSKLTPEQAMYHFISGYTAKVAGTEKGMSREPTAIFSTCFGAPFMSLHPSVYADMLGEKIAKHNVRCWLVNTGWTGGAYGVGKRIEIKYTRAMINAILDGQLVNGETKEDPVFGVHVPVAVKGVPKEYLFPRNTWKTQKPMMKKPMSWQTNSLKISRNMRATSTRKFSMRAQGLLLKEAKLLEKFMS